MSDGESRKLYYLDRDGDGHWFIVEAARRAEFNAWRRLGDEDPNDPRGWDAPDFARPLGGSPTMLEFYLP